MSSWYYVDEGEAKGPVEEAELVRLVNEGRLDRQSLVTPVGATSWSSVAEYAEQLGLGALAAPPLPTPVAGAPIAYASEPEAQPDPTSVFGTGSVSEPVASQPVSNEVGGSPAPEPDPITEVRHEPQWGLSPSPAPGPGDGGPPWASPESPAAAPAATTPWATPSPAPSPGDTGPAWAQPPGAPAGSGGPPAPGPIPHPGPAPGAPPGWAPPSADPWAPPTPAESAPAPQPTGWPPPEAAPTPAPNQAPAAWAPPGAAPSGEAAAPWAAPVPAQAPPSGQMPWSPPAGGAAAPPWAGPGGAAPPQWGAPQPGWAPPGAPQQWGQRPAPGAPQGGSDFPPPPGYPTPATSGAGYGVGQEASWGIRLLAWVIDFIVLLVPTILLSVLFGGDLTTTNSAGDATLNFDGGASWFLTCLMWILYRGLLHGLKGQTLGQMIVGIRVVDANTGRLLSLGRAFGREALMALGLFLCFLPFLLDALSPLWDKRNQAWHDKVASSVVLKGKPEPAT